MPAVVCPYRGARAAYLPPVDAHTFACKAPTLIRNAQDRSHELARMNAGAHYAGVLSQAQACPYARRHTNTGCTWCDVTHFGGLVIDAQKEEGGGSQQIRRVPAGRQVSYAVLQPRPSRVLPYLTNQANQHASCRPGLGPPEIGQQVPACSGAATGGTSVAALARGAASYTPPPRRVPRR